MRNSDRKWHNNLQKFINLLLKNPFKETIPIPRIISEPSANILLVRGISWRDDDTFRKLELELVDDTVQANPIRYSYKGFESIEQPPNYSPRDILLGNMISFVEIFDEYIRYLLNYKPSIEIVAFSLGGLVVANWICRPDPPNDHREMIENISSLTFIGSPLYIDYPTIPIKVTVSEIETKDWEWTVSPTIKVNGGVKQYNRQNLLSLSPNALLNIYSQIDRIAPEKFSKLQGVRLSDKRIDERTVRVIHAKLPNEGKTLNYLWGFWSRNRDFA